MIGPSDGVSGWKSTGWGAISKEASSSSARNSRTGASCNSSGFRNSLTIRWRLMAHTSYNWLLWLSNGGRGDMLIAAGDRPVASATMVCNFSLIPFLPVSARTSSRSVIENHFQLTILYCQQAGLSRGNYAREAGISSLPAGFTGRLGQRRAARPLGSSLSPPSPGRPRAKRE